jgi:hypothetical protein
MNALKQHLVPQVIYHYSKTHSSFGKCTFTVRELANYISKNIAMQKLLCNRWYCWYHEPALLFEALNSMVMEGELAVEYVSVEKLHGNITVAQYTKVLYEM